MGRELYRGPELTGDLLGSRVWQARRAAPVRFLPCPVHCLHRGGIPEALLTE